MFAPRILSAGLTGTHKGMTFAQQRAVALFLAHSMYEEARHGDCIGADAEFHLMAVNARIPRIVIHPPDNPKRRAFCDGPNVTILPEKPYLVRDHDMVDAISFLLATPETVREIQRSGTWATVRYARKVHRDHRVIYPNGDHRDFNY
jgi:hypothetical protein